MSLLRVAITVAATEDAVNAVAPPNCDDLYAAAEAIQQLITEHCPIVAARPTIMKVAKKK